MKYNIALSGRFDLKNYGDLLLPEILKKAMKKRGLDFELFLFSPNSSQYDEGNTEVYSIYDMERVHKIHPFDAVIIGSGATISYETVPLSLPDSNDTLFYKNSDTWLYPSNFAIKHNIKLLYSLPQVPQQIEEGLVELTHFLIEKANYISLSDETSKNNLFSSLKGVDAPNVNLFPDIAGSVSEFIEISELDKIRKSFDLNTPYAVLNFNASTPQEDEIYLKALVEKLKSRGLEIVFLPLGEEEYDALFMNDFNQRSGKLCKQLDKDLTTLEKTALLAGCEIYIGTNLDAAITTISYCKKSICYNCSQSFKPHEAFSQYNIGEFAVDNGNELVKISYKIFEGENFSPNLTKTTASINQLFDDIFTHITSPKNVADNSTENADRFYSLSTNILSKVQTFNSIDREIFKIKAKNSELKRVIDQKDNDIYALQQNYAQLNERLVEASIKNQQILSSQYWKITKPFRITTEKAKKALNRFVFTRNIIKALQILFSFGPRELFRRIKKNTATSISSTITEKQRKFEEGTKFNLDIKFSILVPLYNTPIDFLKEMIDSVQAQTYKNWELCLADGSDAKHPEVEEYISQHYENDNRIVYKKLEKNLGISENTNACIKMATGDYIALFDHDDILHPSALFSVMKEICEKGADFIYTDEATFESPNINKIITAHYKPDYAHENLLANNYICHFSVFNKKILDQTGLFRHEYDGSQDHDMILRLTDNAKTIVHIPKILYFWRSHPNSVALDIESKAYAINAGISAVRDNIAQNGCNALVKSSRAFPTIYEVHYEITNFHKVSIIIPNKNHKNDLKRCITSILALSTYPNYEIIIVDNGSNDNVLEYYEEIKQNPKIKIVSLDIPFNFSKLNNYGASQASGDYFLMLNNDTEIITPNWIEELLMHAQHNYVGAVGAKLYYPDNTIQHAGIVLGMGSDKVAGHIFYKIPKQELGYMGRLCYTQNLSAVTAACMMVRRDVWEKVGGLDEGFAVAYNDVDFCLRIQKEGYKIVWTPFAELYHYESKSRGSDNSGQKRDRFNNEVNNFKTRWKDALEAGDPYFNPNFSLEHSDFRVKSTD